MSISLHTLIYSTLCFNFFFLALFHFCLLFLLYFSIHIEICSKLFRAIAEIPIESSIVSLVHFCLFSNSQEPLLSGYTNVIVWIITTRLFVSSLIILSVSSMRLCQFSLTQRDTVNHLKSLLFVSKSDAVRV